MNEVKVLEIGFGTGLTSKIILDADPRIKLAALDNEPIMEEKITSYLSSYSNRITVKIADALEFLKSLPDNSFDAVASAFVLHNFLHTYRTGVLEQIYRILKPNGLLINADKIADSDPAQHEKNLKWQIEQFDIFEKMGKLELKKEWTQHYLDDDKPDRVLIESQYLQDLDSIGYKSHAVYKRWRDDATVLAHK